jgi:ABC-type uncharacterized transport system ATPase subunit
MGASAPIIISEHALFSRRFILILDRLTLTNFKRFRDVEIRFQDGITGILGNNGTGKSSLVRAGLIPHLGGSSKVGQLVARQQSSLDDAGRTETTPFGISVWSTISAWESKRNPYGSTGFPAPR